MRKLIALFLLLPTLAFGADYFDWTVRTDRDGKPAGYFTTTPFPVTEASTTYAITNDEGTKTYTLGTIYFVDGTLSGTCAGSYLPSSRACSGGSYTAYKTIAAALAGVGSGNKTILVRDGTYTESGFTAGTGTGDLTRFHIIGYNQERPVIDGGDGTNDIFGTSTVTNKYVTLQRLKLQNTRRNGIRLGNSATKYDGYYNVIDVHMYQVNYLATTTTGTPSGDAGVYFLNADNGWAYHVTVERTLGHGIKMGDGADNGIIEWSKAFECGYWTTMVADLGITDWGGTHPSGIDLPNDSGVESNNNRVRYNIAYDTLFYGMQLRNTTDTDAHHNEIYNTPHFDDVPSVASGVTGSPQVLILEYGGCILDNLTFRANVVRDSSDANSSGILVSRLCNGKTVNIYNDLVYNNPLAEIYLYGYLDPAGTTRLINIFNNTLVHGNYTTPAIGPGTNYATGEVILKNNIINKTGTGALVAFDPDFSHTYNLYYAPSGSVGVTLGTGEINANPLIAAPSGAYSSGEGAPQAGSVAIDNGITTAYATSFNGVTRATWDIGAYEFGEYTPTLTSPLNLTISRPVTFEWEAFTGARKYQIQVDNNSDFSSPEVDVEIDCLGLCDATDTTYETATDDLAPSTTYYWHVRALR